MSLSKKLAVVAVSTLALAGFGASSAMADYAVHVTNPGAIQLNSSASVLTVSGSAAANCDVTINGTVSTSGVASGVSFTIAPGTANCSNITATSSGGAICEDTSGNLYLKAQVTVFNLGSPIGAGTIKGDLDDAGTLLTFANSPIVGLGTLAIDGDYDVIGDPIEIDKTTTDACSV